LAPQQQLLQLHAWAVTSLSPCPAAAWPRSLQDRPVWLLRLLCVLCWSSTEHGLWQTVLQEALLMLRWA
jgi:hypothetical protein